MLNRNIKYSIVALLFGVFLGGLTPVSAVIHTAKKATPVKTPIKKARSVKKVHVKHALVSIANSIVSSSGFNFICPGGSITLSTNPAPPGATYQWYDSSGQTISTDPSITVSTPDTYGVNVNGLAYPSVVIGQGTPPNPSFTHSPDNQCTTTPVKFTNTTPGSQLTYQWDFNDPNSGTSDNSTAASPSHTFVGTPGDGVQSFDVTLVVTNNMGCQSSIDQQVNVLQPADTRLLGTGYQGNLLYNGLHFFAPCTNSPTLFTFTNVSTTTNTSYNIKWGDGSPDFNSAAYVSTTHNYNLGTNILTYTVTDINGCTTTQQYLVYVGGTPAIGLQSNTNASLCTGAPLTINVTGAANNPPGTTYVVTFSDGSTPQTYTTAPATIVHEFTQSSYGFTSPDGQYTNAFTATIKATNPCSSASAVVEPIYVSDKPTAVVDVAGEGGASTATAVACTGSVTTITNVNASNYYVAANGNGLQNNSIFSISPSTYTVISGAMGSTNGQDDDPSQWTSADPQLMVSFDQPGNYSITLTTANPIRVGLGGCGSDQTTKTVCINPFPVAAFHLDKTDGCGPLTVTASNNSNLPTCGVNTYQWSIDYDNTGCAPNSANYTFVNGTDATSANPQIMFNTPGLYTLTLVTTSPGNGCTSTPVSQVITVKAKPIVNLSGIQDICQNNTITPVADVVNCYSSIPETYLWTFTGGTPATSTAASPGDILYKTGGTFQVILAVSNECGTTTQTQQIVVTPTATAVVPATMNICNGAANGIIHFTSPVAGTDLSWTSDTDIGFGTSGDGDIPAFTVQNTTGALQTATVTVTPSNACPGPPVSFIINVYPTSLPPVATSTVTYCLNDAATALTATAISGSTLKWYKTAALTGGTTTAPVPVTSATGTTQYYVTQVNGGGCESTATMITVTVNPPITGNMIGTSQIICSATAPATLASTATIAGGDGNYSYQWQYSTDNGATWTNGDVTASLNPGALSGTTQYRRIVSSGSCQSTSNTVTVTVQGVLANYDISSSQSICTGNIPALLQGQTPAGGNGTFTFQWESSPDNSTWTAITGATASNYQPPALTVTTYYQRIVNSGTCTATSSVVTITINPVATVNAIADETVCNGATVPATNFSSTPAGNTTFTWAKDNTAIGTPATSGSGDIASFTAANSSKAPITSSITVTPTYTAGQSCPGTPLTFKITVLPTIALSVIGNSTVCSGDQVAAFTPVNDAAAFTNSSVTYRWTGGAAIGLADAAGSQLPAFTAVNSGTADLVATIVVTPVYNYNGTSCDGTPASYNITVNPKPTTSNAGADDKTCATSYQLNGNTPVVGTGTWTLTSGPIVAFANINTPNTNVTGLQKGTEYQFTWSIANNTCAISSSSVKLDVLTDIINTIKPSSSSTCSGQPVTISTDALSGGDVPSILAANYTYTWESSADGVSGWQAVTNGNQPSLVVNPAVITYYRRTVSSNGLCPVISNVIQINISAAAPAANAGSPIIVCAQTQAQLNANDPGPGFTGTWSDSAPGSTLTFSPNANTFNATVNGLAPNTNYQLVWTISSPSCGLNTSTVAITDLPVLTNQVGPATSAVCSGQPVTITGAAATGGAGNYQYTWESSADGITWTTISGQTGATITFTPTASVNLRRNVISGTCNLESNTVIITVQPPLSNNTISGAQQVCTGVPPLPLTGSAPAGGDGIYSYQWQESTTPTDATSWVNSVNGTSINFSPVALTVTTYYRRIVTSALCTGPQSNTSAYIQVTVNPNAKAEFSASKLMGCAPFNLQAVITPVAHDDVDGTYQWYANGVLISNSSSSAFPAYSITASGQTVTIKLIAVSKFGCTSDEMSQDFSTVGDVTASFATSPVKGCGDQSLSFTNTSTPLAGATYAWDLGNGQTSTLAQPGNILFTQAKLNHDTTYTITLVASTGCITSTFSNTITIKPALKAVFTPDVTTGCSPLSVNFTNQSGGVADQFVYDFGDGTTQAIGTNAAVQHTYNVTAVTKFNVQLTATNECGTDVSSYVIVVYPNSVTANLVVNGDNKTGCAPYTVTFYNNSTGANLFTYNFKDGTKTSQSVVPDSVKHTFTKPGTYNVSLAATNGCSTDSTIETITILPTPVVNFTSNKLVYCVGDNAVFTNNTTPTGTLNYAWDFGDKATSTDANPKHIFTTAGKYNVKLTASQNTTSANCAVADSISITVLALPKATLSSNNSSLNCAPFVYSANSAPNDATSVTWDFGDPTSQTNTLSGSTAQHTFTKAGTYTITMTAFNLAGCSNITTETVIIAPSPVAGFSITNNLSCAPLVANIVNNSVNADNYKWYLNNKLVSTDQTPTNVILGQINQTYQLKLVVSNVNGCNADSVTQTIGTNGISNQISPAATVVCSGQAVTLTGTSADNGSAPPLYIWESTTDGTNWTVIADQSGQSLTFIPTASVKIRRNVVSGACNEQSDTVSVTVQPPLTNNVITAPQQICLGATATALQGSLPGGGDGVYLYHWQQSTNPADPTTWLTTANAGDQQNYVPGAIKVSTYYRRIVTSALCNGPQSDTSAMVEIIVNPLAKAEFAVSQLVGCTPFDLQSAIIPIAHDNDDGIYKWYANGVLLSTSTSAAFPPFTMTKTGMTDTIKLVAISKAGCGSDTVSMVFSTVPSVTASFVNNPVTGCGPQTVNFVNTSTPINGGTYFWDFGNGQTSGTVQPGSIVFKPGPLNSDTTYTVTLTAVTGCDINTYRDSIRIKPGVKVEFTPDKTTGCSPFVVTINNQSTGTANQYTYDFGDGAKQFVTGNQPVKHTYVTSKIDTVILKLSAKNLACGMDSSSYKIVVYPNTVLANLVVNGNNKAGCSPYTVTFYNNSVGANLFNYDFNDGSTALQSKTPDSVTYTFAKPGIYNVKLTASNPCSTATAVQTITVLASPNVNFTPNKLQYCLKDTAFFKNNTTVVTSPATLSYLWNFGDGFTSSDINPAHVYASAGKYTVTLTAFQNTTTANCTTMDSVQITVVNLASAKFSTNYGNVTCTPYLLSVNSSPTNAVSVSWIFDDPSSATNYTTGFTSQHLFTKAGTYHVKMIAYNSAGCGDTTVQKFQINASPIANFSVANTMSCVPFNVSIINNSIFADSYAWYINNKLVSTAQTPSIVLNHPGETDSLKLVVSNIYGCRSDSLSVALVTSPKPVAAFSLEDSISCTGVLNLNVKNLSTNATSYTWKFGDNTPDSNSPVPVHAYSRGKYVLTLIAYYGACTDTVSHTVKIDDAPKSEFSANITSGCEQVTTTFQNLSVNATHYQWDFGDGNMLDTTGSGAVKHSYNYKNSPFTVKLIAYSELGCTDTTIMTNLIAVSPPLVAAFEVLPDSVINIPNNTFTFSNTTNGDSVKYTWNFGDGIQSVEKDPAHTYKDTGIFKVQLMAVNSFGCQSAVTHTVHIKTIPQYLYVPNAFEPGSIRSELQTFNVRGAGMKSYTLQVFNNWGQLIFETTALDGSGAPTTGWDGTMNGQPAPQDTYIWRASARFVDGTQWSGMKYRSGDTPSTSGIIHLIR